MYNKTATDCCQMERQIQRDAWGYCSHSMSLNNACTWTVHKWL